MEQKEIRLNASKRKSLTNDYRRHCETQHSHEKEDFFDSREKATEAIDSSFATIKNAVPHIPKQVLPLEDAWYVEYKYGYNLDESTRYHLINRLKGIDRVITKQQAQTPDQQAEEYGNWQTIDDTQAKELAITLGLAS